MPKFNPPEQFDFRQPSGWRDWKQRFLRFRTATKLKDDDGDVQVSSLIYAMGSESEQIFKSFTFDTEEAKKNFDTVLGKFDNHFEPRNNIIHERSLFNRRDQLPEENVETFIRHLYDLSQNCDYGDSREDMIRDRLVIGLLDKSISQKLQLISDLKLDTAIQKAREYELIK